MTWRGFTVDREIPEEIEDILLVAAERVLTKINLTFNCDRSDILITEFNGFWYILGNPVVGEECIYNESGEMVEVVPKRNITLMYYSGIRMETQVVDGAYKVRVSIPRVRVLIPEFCTRIRTV